MQDVNINLVLFHDNLKTKRAHDVVKPKLRTNISNNIMILQYSLNIMTNLQTMSLCFYGLQVYGTFPSYIDVLFPLSLRRLLPGLTISTWRMSDGKQELITLPEHMCSHPVFWWVLVAHHFSFLCCVFVVAFFVFVLCLVSIVSCVSVLFIPNGCPFHHGCRLSGALILWS
jgi:hypothetical protein